MDNEHRKTAIIAVIGEEGLEQMVGYHNKGELACLDFLTNGIVYKFTHREETDQEKELAYLRACCATCYSNVRMGLPATW